MSHPNIPKDKARPWLVGEVQEPEEDDEAPYGDEQQQEQEQ